MNDRVHQVFFDESGHKPVTMPAGANICENLSVDNSPILFGCRTGICGTCMIEVSEVLNGRLAAPAAEEIELLNLMAPGNKRARLACQLKLDADIRVKPLSWK